MITLFPIYVFHDSMKDDYKQFHYFHEYIATYQRSFNCNPVILTFSTKEKDYHHYIFPGYTPYKYYVPIFQRERIQSDMECMAVNLILRNITGDHTFIYL